MDLYADLAERRAVGDAVAEEVEVLPDGRRRPWFGVYRWDAVRAALADEALSSGLYDQALGLDGRYGPVLIGLDAPAHRHHRAAVQPLLARAALAGPVAAAIEDVAGRLVGAIAPAGAMDLLTAVCEPLPVLLLAELLGLPDDVSLLGAQALAVGGDVERATAASDALRARVDPVIAARRERPGPDLVSRLATLDVGDRPLADLEVFSHVRLLALAGTDTVSRAAGNLLAGLLTHPDQLAAVDRDRRHVPAAVDEALRWECPALSVPRLALRATQIGAVEIPAGAAVRCCLGAANRDPARWVDPDRFDVFREPKPNAAFGLGAHACLGLHLATQVLGGLLEALLDRLRGLRVDPEAPAPEVVGTDLRGPDHLHAVWDPA